MDNVHEPIAKVYWNPLFGRPVCKTVEPLEYQLEANEAFCCGPRDATAVIVTPLHETIFVRTTNAYWQRPPNDEILHSTTINSYDATITGSTTGSTLGDSPGDRMAGSEFPGAGSLWYKWAAPASGTATISVQANHLFRIFIKDAAQADEWDHFKTTFPVIQDKFYFISVIGRSQINIEGNVGDFFQLRLAIDSPLPLQLTQPVTGQTYRSGEPIPVVGRPTSRERPLAQVNLYFSLLGSSSTGVVTMATNNVFSSELSTWLTGDIILSVYAGEVMQPARIPIRVLPSNDYFADRKPLGSGNVEWTSSYHFATREPGEPVSSFSGAGGSLWWTWRASSAGKVRLICERRLGSTATASLYSGSAFSQLQVE